MTETPRTHEEVKRTAGIGAMSGMEQAWQDMCYFASQLERELFEATKDAERYRKVREAMSGRKWRHLPHEISEHMPEGDDEDSVALEATLDAAVDAIDSARQKEGAST